MHQPVPLTRRAAREGHAPGHTAPMRVEAPSGSVQQVFLASAVIAGCIAFTIGLTDSFVHPETPILEDSWERVAEEARRYVLPEEPMLLRDSPMQAWLKGRDDLWGQGPHWWQGPEGFSKAVSGSPGDLKVSRRNSERLKRKPFFFLSQQQSIETLPQFVSKESHPNLRPEFVLGVLR